MKNIILGIFILTSMTVFGQSNTRKLQLVDELLSEVEVREKTKQLIGSLIKQYMAKKPDAPKSLEHEIQKAIDYDSYVVDVKAVYDKVYTEEEIKELIQVYKSGDMKLYKQKSEKVNKYLYDIGSLFGKNAVKVIIEKLQPY